MSARKKLFLNMDWPGLGEREADLAFTSVVSGINIM